MHRHPMNMGAAGSISWRGAKDALSTLSMRLSLIFINGVALLILASLVVRASPILARTPLPRLLLSSTWHPMKGEFGLYPFIISTLGVTILAMGLALPPCILSAIYLSDYAPRRFRELAGPVIDLLAAIPSVIYGLWGVIIIVPAVRTLGERLGIQTTGYSLLAGGIILAIMVSPILISVTTEVLRVIPIEAREAALALGATRWETVKHVVLLSGRQGILAAVILALSRALGETMAVLMVVGNVPKIPGSVFDPVYPLPALIANNYGEVMSIPLYDSALLLAALILLVVVSISNLAAHSILTRFGAR